MRLPALVMAALTAVILATALWADGSRPGGIIVSAPLLGFAVFYSARKCERLASQLLIVFVYLSSVALGGATAFLINKVYYGATPDALLSGGGTLSAVVLGLAVCDAMLRTRMGGLGSSNAA